MARKKAQKRQLAQFRQSQKLPEVQQFYLSDFDRRWKSGLPELEGILGFKFTEEERAYLQAALFVAVIEPLHLQYFIVPKRKPFASWRDDVILTLRAILAKRGRSTSLSYMCDQTTIDTEFANALRITFKMMPDHCGGKSVSALVARARGLRTKFRYPPDAILSRQFERGLWLLRFVTWHRQAEQSCLNWAKNGCAEENRPIFSEPSHLPSCPPRLTA